MDNKYANLPGIARNEPDVYETPNVSSTLSEKLTPNEDDTINVTKINITTKEARDKFNTGYLNSDHVDFSDNVTNRRKYGYIVDPDRFEWSQDLSEGPLQRYQRLEKELTELKEDLSKISSSSDVNLNFDPVDLTKSVETLQKRVNSLHLQSIGAGSRSELDSKAKKQLLIDNLNEFKMNLNKKSTKSDQQKTQVVDAAANSLIFKLFSDLDESDLAKANKISELNRRMANLEKVFGAGNSSVGENHLNKLCSNLDNKTILGLIEHLNSRVNLLDSASLDQIESRLHILSQRVSQLNEKKIVIEDQEKLARVNELYSMITNWRDASATVPAIVERLSALNDIHQKAFQFSSVLSRLDSEQQSIKQTIETSSDALNQLKANLQSNLESIKSSFDVLNERIVTISQK